MPTYEYRCPNCDARYEWIVPISERGAQRCTKCDTLLEQQIAAPAFKFAGRVVQGGGPDRFTADVLGVSLKDLPDGLRTPKADGGTL